MVEERRKSVRIKKMLSVRYAYPDENGVKKWDITSVRDISETGMSITTEHGFSANDTLTFLVKIPSKPLDWEEFTGRVVCSESARPGSSPLHITRVEFINLRDEQKQLVREYISWFLAK
ncbi:MAG: PilZ domain-containing protein [Candidatus Omnitrophica bacterium]|nr:PilZ domain-containing protein [Candidatus Omnitrophota bacterium]MDD5553877.1 PilZ domain-containing protein [Candidatus Omnitrophota bacterium]